MAQTEHTYWQMVEQLLHIGWYREGKDLKRDPSGRSWRSRAGHTIDARSVSQLWIVAPDELTAMRILLQQLQHSMDARKRQPAAGEA